MKACDLTQYCRQILKLLWFCEDTFLQYFLVAGVLMLYVWVEQGNMRQSDTEADINCELRQSVKKFSVKVRK